MIIDGQLEGFLVEFLSQMAFVNFKNQEISHQCWDLNPVSWHVMPVKGVKACPVFRMLVRNLHNPFSHNCAIIHVIHL